MSSAERGGGDGLMGRNELCRVLLPAFQPSTLKQHGQRPNQAADLIQVSVSTLKGWFSQGRFARCVKRGKPARVIRDLFVVEFLRDEFGINAE